MNKPNHPSIDRRAGALPGATLREARVGHLYAVTEPVEDSRVALEAAP
jgi:hypothetical protein